MWKDWIRPIVRPLPQWSTVAVVAPQQVVIATLRWDGRSVDVTADHTVASLQPLVIATSVDAGPSPLIEYSDSITGKLLGVLHLAQAETILVDETSVNLYNVTAGDHRCLGWPRRPWNARLQNRSMLKNRAPHQMAMDTAAVQQLMVAYLCPRPVILASVDTSDHRNIFPMDLIGPLRGSGLFSLALRSTNVSEPVMREAHRVALSNMPAAMKALVYKLSEHHKQAPSDWHALSFPLRPSRKFDIPAAAGALRVQELDIVHSREIGSHTFFLGRIVSDEHMAEGAQLHHTAGFHQAYRRSQGMPFAEV